MYTHTRTHAHRAGVPCTLRLSLSSGGGSVRRAYGSLGAAGEAGTDETAGTPTALDEIAGPLATADDSSRQGTLPVYASALSRSKRRSASASL